MLVRHAIVDDADAIGTVHVQSWRMAYRNILPDEYLADLNVAERISSWREIIEDRSAMLVAEVNEQVVGFANFGPSRDTPLEGSVVELYAIYLHPDFWGQGIGKSLWQTALAEIQMEPPSAVTLWVLEDNLPARRFYEKCGFASDGATKSRKVLNQTHTETRYRLDLASTS